MIADVLPPWHCVNIHLKAPDQLSAKTSAFTNGFCIFRTEKSQFKNYLISTGLQLPDNTWKCYLFVLYIQ